MFETAIQRTRVPPRFAQSFEVALLHQRRAQIAVKPGVIGRGCKRRFKFRDRVVEILARQMESSHRVMRRGGCLERPDCPRSEEHTSELQSLRHLVCRLLLEKKNNSTRQRAARAQADTL